jgi:hypothetical protein
VYSRPTFFRFDRLSSSAMAAASSGAFGPTLKM